MHLKAKKIAFVCVRRRKFKRSLQYCGWKGFMLSFQVHELFMPANLNPLLRPGTAEGKKEKAEQLSLFCCVSSVSWRRGGLLCPQPFTAMPQCKAWPWGELVRCVLENWRLGTRWSWGTRNIQMDETTRVPARVHGKIGVFFNGNRSVSGSSSVLPAALSVPTQEIFFTPMIVLNAKAIACGAKI